MLADLVEGVRASAQPCSMVLLGPVVGVALVGGRAGWAAAAAAAGGALLVAWGQASLLLVPPAPDGLAGVAAAVVLLGLIVWVWSARRQGGLGAARMAGVGAGVGAVAAWVWQPCVGPNFGAALTDAPADRAGALLPIGLHLAGLLAAAAVVAALPHLRPRDGEDPTLDHRPSPMVSALGCLPLVLLAAILASSRGDAVVGALVRISSL